MKTTAFHDCLELSRKIDYTRLSEFLATNIPDFLRVDEISDPKENQALGDFRILRRGKPSLTLEVKVGQLDPIGRYGEDRFPLEGYSRVERGHYVPGWPFSDRCSADLLLYYFRDTHRMDLLPYRAVCLATRAHARKWRKEYHESWSKTKTTRSSYKSSCLHIPAAVLRNALAPYAASLN